MNTKKILLTALTLVASSGIAFSTEYTNIFDNELYTNLNVSGVRAFGAAINTKSISSLISNSVFENNTSDSSMYSLGGAIFNSSLHLKITDSIFNGNKAIKGSDGNYGGAIFADASYYKTELNSHMIIENSSFSNNGIEGGKGIVGGGAIASQCVKDIIINHTSFNNNFAKGNAAQSSNYVLGGAIAANFFVEPMLVNWYATTQTLTINNSEFNGNYIEGPNSNFGGAIGGRQPMDINISDTVFNENYILGGKTSKGGAIGLIGEDNINISRSKFENNYITDSTSAAGGVIYSQNSKLNIDNSEFINNYIKNSPTAYGGAIMDIGSTITINNSRFKENHILGTTSAKGGVFGTTGNVTLNITDSLFESNYINGGTTAMGGVIYTQLSKLNIDNTDFINNFIENAASAYGGAITDIGSTITVKNSRFLGNYVNGTSSAGGAIYFQGNGASVIGTLNLIADGKDVEFTGNMANNVSNAIYQSSNTRLNLNAASGNKIIFNDRITSSATNAIMNINGTNSNYPTDGTIVLNNYMTGYWGEVNLYGGTLKLGEDGTLFHNASKFTSNNGVTIDLQNSFTEESKFKNLVLNGTTNLMIDVDLANDEIDTINATASSGTGNFHIADINVLEDFSAETGSFTKEIFKGVNTQATMESTLKTIFTQGSKYYVNLNNNALSVDKSVYTDGLLGALANEDDRQYHMSNDEVISDWGSPSGNDMQGGTLLVQGKGNSIIGNDNQGININIAQELILNGVGAKDDDGNITNSLNGFHSENGGAIYNEGGAIVIADSIIANNTAENKGGAIYNNGGVVNVIANNKDVIFSDNKADKISNAIHNDGGTVNLNTSSDKSIIFNDKITSEDSRGEININASKDEVGSVKHNVPASGTVILNNDMSGYKGDINLYHGTIKVGENGNFFNPENFNIHGCTLDFGNSKIQNYNLGNLSIADRVDLIVDADLANSRMDTISANNIITDSGKINVDKINLLSDATGENLSIRFTDGNLKETVTYSGSDISYSPIFKYGVNYDKDRGEFDFNRFGGGGNNYNSFNPSVFAAPVAAQMGGYLSQLNSYDQAFMNIDMKMLMTREERETARLHNKYASTNASPIVFSPTFLQEKERGVWARPYASFETVKLRGGPSVSNVMYGTFMGGDSEIFDLGNGFEGQVSLYAGYNGSHQTFDGNSLYQNGGNIGATGVIYKGNFYSALTANTGASSVEASTMYGSEQFPMLMAGVASKTGYNWELAKGKFIIQPNYLMSYTFVNAYDYTNAGGVRITSDPLNAIQISPGIKFIGNLKNGWQPYASISMVWNIMDQTKFQAAAVSLPQLSVKPYIEYGVGIQKRWGDRFTGYFQTMIRNGGRNGVALSFGMRWSLGKTPKNTKATAPLEKKIITTPTSINLSCNK